MILAAGFCLVLAGYASLAVGAYNHDESQYLLGGRLLAGARIYADYLYLQPPYHAVELSGVYLAIGPEHYFLAARLLNAALAAAVVALFYRTLRGATRLGPAAAALATLLFASCDTLFVPFGSARNDVLPLFFSAAAAMLLLDRSACELTGARLFAIGALLGAAAMTKLSYVHMPVAALVYLLATPGAPDRAGAARRTVPLVIGGAMAAAPALAMMARDPHAAIYGLIGYHRSAPFEWYRALGLSHRLTFTATVKTVLSEWRGPALLAATVICVLAALRVGAAPSRWRAIWREDRAVRLMLLVTLFGAPVVLAPMPSWPPYYPPLIWSWMLLVFALLARAAEGSRVVSWVAAALCLLGGASGVWDLARDHAWAARRRAYWTTLQVAQNSRAIDAELDRRHLAGPIATLSPERVIDSIHGFYPALATGAFAYRTAGRFDDAELSRLHIVSPRTIGGLLARDPPAAIYGGHEQRLGIEAPLFAFAEAHGYRRLPDTVADGILFVREERLPANAIEPASAAR